MTLNASSRVRSIAMLVTILFTIVLFLSGCSASVGAIKGQGTDAGVLLGKNNYKIIKVSARGESSGFKILGLIPIVSPSYADAKDMLYASIGESLQGRSIALVNQTEDRSSLYVILFSIPKVTISADVIEYIDEPRDSIK